MTPQAALIELLERVGAKSGAAVMISEHELGQWPSATVSTLKAQGLLTKAGPASSVVCPGCERECVMPVHTLPGTPCHPASFIVCDKRSDINRVAVPISCLEQWQVSGASVAAFLAGSLGVRRPSASSAHNTRWEIGKLKGLRYASHVVLLAEGKLRLAVAGHTTELTDVLTLKGGRLAVDLHALRQMVDQPVAGAGDVESAALRRDRLKKRVKEVAAEGVRGFLKAVAEEEGISVSRLKQLVKGIPESAKASFGSSAR